jgi:hypothetical protein
MEMALTGRMADDQMPACEFSENAVSSAAPGIYQTGASHQPSNDRPALGGELRDRAIMIKITASSLILGAMLFVGAAQAEPAKLTTSQMDQVTAGGYGDFDITTQINKNYTEQYAKAYARCYGCYVNSATAFNVNETEQKNVAIGN